MEYMKNGPLYPYHERVRQFAKGKNKIGFEVFYGGGKTWQTLQWFADRLNMGEQMFPALVLCPSTLITQWRDQIEEHSYFSSICITGSRKQRVLALSKEADIYLINYDATAKAVEKYKVGKKTRRRVNERYPTFAAVVAKRFQTVVGDESTLLKTDTTSRFMAIKKSLGDVKHRSILTGKLITEKAEDIYAQMLFLDLGATFGKSYWKFRTRFFTPGPAWEPYKWTLKVGAAQMMGHMISAKVIRVKREEIMDQLPPQRFIDVNLDMPVKVRATYEELRKKFQMTLPSGKAYQTQWAMVKSRKLHEICQGFVYTNEPSTNDFNDHNGSYELLDHTKLDWLAENVPLMVKEGPLLIWSNYTLVCKMISMILDKVKISHSLYLGTSQMKVAERERQKQLFLDGKNDVMILGEQAGYQGLNLQRSNQSILVSLDYKAEWFANLIQRNHRIGSEIHDSITYYSLNIRKSIDQIVRSAIHDKLDVAEAILKYIRAA